MDSYGLEIRVGDVTDIPAVMALFDGAVAWLVARGRAGQWGSRPWSEVPELAERVRRYAEKGELRIAELDGTAVGACRIGDAVGADFCVTSCDLRVFVDEAADSISA